MHAFFVQNDLGIEILIIITLSLQKFGTQNFYNMYIRNINVNLFTHKFSSTFPIRNKKWRRALYNNILTLE